MRWSRGTLSLLFAALVFAAIGPALGAIDKKTERTWRANCSSCHGREGLGDTEQGKQMKIPSMATAEWQQKLTDDQIRTTITNGLVREEGGVKKEMEPFKEKLKPAEIDALVTHVRSFAPKN